jgi:TonB family protein
MRKAAYPFILVLILTTAFSLTATPRQDNVYAVGDGVSPPVAVKNVTPAYTPEAREARVQGTVLLQAVVTTEGNVTDIKVLQSLGYGPGRERHKRSVTVALQARFEGR